MSPVKEGAYLEQAEGMAVGPEVWAIVLCKMAGVWVMGNRGRGKVRWEGAIIGNRGCCDTGVVLCVGGGGRGRGKAGVSSEGSNSKICSSRNW